METLVFETELGHVALARQSNRLLALTFGHSNERLAIKALAKRLPDENLAEVEVVNLGEDELADRLLALAAGEAIDFDELQVEDGHLTDFGRKVTDACRQIPYGETVTYGQLAQRAGRPGAARAVGSIMARNRVPLVVPCHRVVPASGGLGGFSAPQGVTMKKRLLDMEQDVLVSG